MTGAARGQGIAIVARLVAQDYDVVACDVLRDELSAATSGLPPDRLLALELDVSSGASWASAVEATRERFGGLDALVNNAGILYRAPLADDDPAAFERAWRVNCLGPMLGIQTCLPLLRDSASAAVVNTVSSSGMHPFPNHAGYTSSKWALRGLTLAAAAELGLLGIRVNAVFPGPIATPMHDAETTHRLASAALLGRVGEAGEVAAAVAFLLSPDASFVVGAELLVDGGQLLRIGT
ncbi:MAG TPA: SDR family oxidoreductase [Pseudolysinimonas sp.]|nr:SDR family oxidoreductase [Pseudolysinimonas sp.]